MLEYWRSLTLLLFLSHVLFYSFNICISIVAGKHVEAILKRHLENARYASKQDAGETVNFRPY